jgi:hypothetical protein
VAEHPVAAKNADADEAYLLEHTDDLSSGRSR